MAIKPATLDVLIVGCGYVGTELAARLVSAGHRVTGVRRSTEADLPDGVTLHTADVSDPALELPGCDVLVYAVSAGGFSQAAYQAAYVDGVRHTLDALARTDRGLPPLGLFVSSTGVYGQTDGSLVDEDSPAEPQGFSGRCMLDGERLVAERLDQGVAVRLAGIYGAERTRLVRSVLEGTARRPRQPRWTNRIHRDDCAGFIAHLVDNHRQGQALEPIYLGVDDDPADYAEVVCGLAEMLGVPAPPLADEDDARSRRRPATNKRCSNARLHDAGYSLVWPTWREGYAPIAAALSQAPR